MSRKVYNVSIFFDLHGVNCPGVWLCPKGKILVKIALFGVSEVTKQVTPAFPLRFNERFHFQKSFRSAQTLTDLHARLRKCLVKMQLIQHPPATTETVILAVFCSPLTAVLYPHPNLKPSETSADVDLLFCPCKIFPGIIAPKAEVSTKIIVKDSMEPAIGLRMNPATVSSQNYRKRMGKEDKIIRQKGVCHTEHNINCKCFVTPKFRDKRTRLLDRVRPPRVPRRSKSISSVSLSEVNQNESSTQSHKQAPPHNKQTSMDDFKMLLDESANNQELSEDELKIFPNIEEDKQEGITEKSSKLCPCCTKEKIQFRNFKTPSSPITSHPPEKPPQEDATNQTSLQLRFAEVKESSSKCEVCNCPVCIKYEDYFIHRALQHGRGTGYLDSNIEPGFQQKKSSDSNESQENTPTTSPTKCYCFKDKKDFKNDIQLKKNNVAIEKNYNLERCYVCKCPLPSQTVDKRNETNPETSFAAGFWEKCSICKCPIASNVSNPGQNYKETLPSSQPREDFYTDLDRYYGQLIHNSERSGQSQFSGTKERVVKKPSSLSLKRRNNWGYREVGNQGIGIWEIKASDWNKI